MTDEHAKNDANPQPQQAPAAGHDHESAPDQEPISKGTAIISLIVFLVVALILGGWGIVSRRSADTVLAERTNDLAAPTVIALPAKQGAPSDTFILPGNVTAYTDSPIYARTSGYLTKWYFDIGARVKKGALLAEISTPELDQQLAQAQADLITAQSSAGNAKVQADRYAGLVKSDAVSRQDTETFVTQAATTSSAVKSAEANVQRVKELQSFEKVYAPFDGVVTARNVDTGQLITEGSASELFHLQSLQTLRVYTNVPQVYSNSMRRGSKIELTFTDYPGKTFEGTLVRTANAIDPVSRTLLVEVDVDNRGGELLPGSLAQVHFKAPTTTPTFVVTSSALIFRREGLRLGTVVNGDTAHLVPVTIGQDDGATVEITTGLTDKDQVIQDPPDSLIEGEKVSVQKPENNTGAKSEASNMGRFPAANGRLMESEARRTHCGERADLRAASSCLRPFSASFWGKSALSAASLAVLLTLSGCKPVGPNYSRPTYTAPPNYKEAGASSVTLPLTPPPNPPGGGWQPANPSDGMLKGKWWEIYQDPQLNQLEERIATYNQGLRQAMETYLAAQDQVKAARSALYPTLSAGPSFSHNRLSQHRPLTGAATPDNYNDLVISGSGSWEPDFWGRIRRTVAAAHENAQASAADMANTNLSLQSMMASDYFQLRGLDAQIKLLNGTIKDLQAQLDLAKQRLDGGVATEVDVAQARTQLESTKAQLVDVGVARAQFEHAVGTIADVKLPGFSIPFSPLDIELPKVPLGVPSQLLERRPDIAAAERRTAAANEQIGIAVSAFYPTISLTGQGGFESTHGGTWIQGPSALWSLGAQATELLFDAGQRRALTNQAKHAYEAQVSGYKGVIFLAFEDVEDQLSGLRILEQESSVQQNAVASAQHSFDVSNLRYKGGVTSYLEVLTAEATLIQNQRTALDLQTRQFVDSVALIKSLGGGWDSSQLPK